MLQARAENRLQQGQPLWHTGRGGPERRWRDGVPLFPAQPFPHPCLHTYPWCCARPSRMRGKEPFRGWGWTPAPLSCPHPWRLTVLSFPVGSWSVWHGIRGMWGDGWSRLLRPGRLFSFYTDLRYLQVSEVSIFPSSALVASLGSALASPFGIPTGFFRLSILFIQPARFCCRVFVFAISFAWTSFSGP